MISAEMFGRFLRLLAHCISGNGISQEFEIEDMKELQTKYLNIHLLFLFFRMIQHGVSGFFCGDNGTSEVDFLLGKIQTLLLNSEAAVFSQVHYDFTVKGLIVSG